MKRILSLLLALCMLFILCACGQASEIKSATSMMEAGDYEGALATLTQLEADEEITAMIAECENAIAYNKAIALVNEGYYAEAYDVFNSIADYKDVANYLDNYKTVEITVDNWDEYFEFKELFAWRENGFGEPEEVESLYGIFIKEEYNDFIIMESSEITSEYSYDASYHDVKVDFEKQSIEVGKSYHKRNDKTGTCTLSEAYYITYEPLFSQTQCLISWPNLYYDVHGAHTLSYEVNVNFSILRTEGTLTYYES